MSVAGRKRKLKEQDDDANDAQSEGDLASPPDHDSQPIEETPAKSHAALRKERKRALKQANTNVDPDSVPVPNKDKNDKPLESLPARQNSVWVGNLAYKTTSDGLKKFFDGVGEITRIHMPTKNVGSGSKKYKVQGDNMGFAYVDFATKDAKTIAIALSETNLDGRKLLIKDGDDFSGRPSAPKDSEHNPSHDAEAKPAAFQPGHSKFAQKVLKNQKQPSAPTLFVGNLPFEIGVQDIRSMLEAHRVSKSRIPDDAPAGEPPRPGPTKWLKKIRLGTFEDSGKCKGWAFLDFMDVSEATAALTNPRNHKLNGRELVLEYASPDAVRRGGQLTGKDSERPRKKPKVDNSKDLPQTESKHHDTSRRHNSHNDHSNTSQTEGKSHVRLGKDGKARPRPGAALAMAKRENVAIVESEGNKIKF